MLGSFLILTTVSMQLLGGQFDGMVQVCVRAADLYGRLRQRIALSAFVPSHAVQRVSRSIRH